jgi:hypothetical protein
MRRSRAVAACAALALAAAPATVTAAGTAGGLASRPDPAAKAPPRMLHGDQWFKGKGYERWVQGDVKPGKQISFLFCGYETMPAAGTLHRSFDADDAYAVQYVTATANGATAQRFATTWLRKTVACTDKRVKAGTPPATTKIVKLGRVQAEDGLRLAGIYYHVPKSPYFGASDRSRLLAVGVDGRHVMTLEVALPDKTPPVKKFKALSATALKQLFR